MCIATAASAVLAWAGKAGAQPIPGVDLHWVAPATCPGAEDLRARVHRLLGPEPPAASQKDGLVVDGTVVRGNGRYRLSLNVRKGRELVGVARVFDSESCESLTGAAAVTLALLVRGGARENEDAPSPPSGTPVPPAVRSLAPLPSPSTARVAPDRPPAATFPVTGEAGAVGANDTANRGWSAILGGPLLAIDEGIVPSWAFGLGLGAGIRVNRFEALLTAVFWLPQNDSAAGLGPYAGRYERRSGGLSTCYEWPLGRFGLGPCVTLALEDVTASGTGPDVLGHPGQIAWMTVAIAARARWSPLPWTALFVSPSLAFNTSRPTFVIDAVGSLYRTPLVAVGIELGSEWIL